MFILLSCPYYYYYYIIIIIIIIMRVRRERLRESSRERPERVASQMSAKRKCREPEREREEMQRERV